MPVPIVVPDASVIVKWVLPADEEPDVDNALLMRSAIVDSTVYALVPPLWIYEVGNTIARRFPEQAQAWMTSLMKFALEEVPASKSWLTKVLELVRLHEVTFYDAAYHALAIGSGGRFVTADARYVNKTKSSGSVMLLSDWQPPPPNPTSRSKRKRQ